MDKEYKTNDDNDAAAPFGVEAGLPASARNGGENNFASAASSNNGAEDGQYIGSRAIQPGSLDHFLGEITSEKVDGEMEGGLLIGGQAPSRIPSSNKDNNEETSCYPPGATESRSVSNSQAAAVPTSLRASRRQSESLPGAFRMNRTGVTPPRADPDDELDPSDDESVGFHTGNAHEVLIEATLVCDQAINERSRDHTSVVHHTAPPEENMALVEAKPVRRFCACCDILGNWKAIFFITLVIVAIAGVALIIERGRQISQKDEALDASLLQNDELIDTPLLLESSMEPTDLRTVPPTNLPSEVMMDELATVEQAAETFDPVSTAPPTSSPTTFAFLLPSYTVAALDDPESPQARAYEWTQQDPNRDDVFIGKLLQRFALATYYYSLMVGADLAGGNDDRISYDKDECEWDLGIALEQACSSDGVYEHFLVRTDHLNSLLGTLPREMWMLTSLISMSLFTRDVAGTLPDEIGGMTELKKLELMDLSLTGALPSGFGALQQLTSLKLQKNGFNSSIPTELGGVQSLQYLYLDANRIGSTLPSELGQLKELKELVLHSNFLQGSLPNEIFHMSKLERIYLSDNNLTGTLPLSELTAPPSLRLLELGNNKLTGSVSSKIGLLTSAIGIDLFGNNLSGTLPEELGLLQNVSMLLLDSNMFSGSIPASLGNMTKLSELWLHNNNFTGSMPTEVCSLKESRDMIISIDCLKVSCSCDCTCSLSSSDVVATSTDKSLGLPP